LRTHIGRGHTYRLWRPFAHSFLGPPQFERKPHLTSGLPTHEVQQSIKATFYWNQTLSFSTSTTLLAASRTATPLPRVQRIKTPLLLLSSVAPPCALSSRHLLISLFFPFLVPFLRGAPPLVTHNRSFTTYLTFPFESNAGDTQHSPNLREWPRL